MSGFNIVKLHLPKQGTSGEGDNLVEVKLEINQPFALSFQSEFSQLYNLDGKISQGASVAAGALNKMAQARGTDKRVGSFRSITESLQFWNNTTPLKLNISSVLYRKTDAKTDVVDIYETLCSYVVPEETKKGDIGRLIPPGATFFDYFDSGKEDFYSSSDSKYYNMNVIYNGLFLRKMLITDVQGSMSNFVDDKGFPISCDLSISLESAFMVTKQYIEKMFRS